MRSVKEEIEEAQARLQPKAMWRWAWQTFLLNTPVVIILLVFAIWLAALFAEGLGKL